MQKVYEFMNQFKSKEGEEKSDCNKLLKNTIVIDLLIIRFKLKFSVYYLDKIGTNLGNLMTVFFLINL